ncbi:MAG: Stp1/IreP family PP2C-type Ser/Thr phosphatase [Roseiflexaceae bacterium]
MKVRHSAHTDVGRTRDHNEDSYGIGEAERAEQLGDLLVICDGMGGHAAGEIASGMAVETILVDYYADETEERPAALEQAFGHANDQIYASGHGSMGTTGVAALIYHDALHVANVGDSRAYLIRGGQIRQVTRDHSFVSDQVAAGLITAEQARSSPHRNVITRALGYQPEVLVDMFRQPLQVGDIILLCSDGLYGLVTDDEITEIASTYPPDEAVGQLIDLANQRGGSDNITVVIALVDALDWDARLVTEEDLAAEHERVTVELPIDEEQLAPPAPPTEEIATIAPAVADPAPIPAPIPARAPVERRLTLLGGLLATLLLGGLLFGTLFALNQPATNLAPLSPTATSLPTPATTSAPSPVTPSPASTAAPTAAAPTAAPTAAAPTAATPRP